MPMQYRRKRKRAGPTKAQADTAARFLRLGLRLRDAALAAGVHVATLCRWQNRDPELKARLHEARAFARASRPDDTVPKRSVPTHSACPECKARVVTRKTKAGVPFWRCGRWPHCSWASWRPRHPRNCRHCKGVRYWSHSRRSVVCGGCGKRTGGTLTRSMRRLLAKFRLAPMGLEDGDYGL